MTGPCGLVTVPRPSGQSLIKIPLNLWNSTLMRYKEQYNQGSFKERGGRAGIYNLFAPMAAIVLILVLAACVAAYDPFEDIRNATDPLFAVRPNADINDISLLQVKVKMGKFHNFCEICTSMLQTKMRGEADLCANLKDDYYVTVHPIPLVSILTQCH